MIEQRELINEQTTFEQRLAKKEDYYGLTDEETEWLRDSGSRSEIYERLTEAIGETPTVQWSLPNNNWLVQKDESENPTESHYDRIFAHLIFCKETQSEIKPGDTLLIVTSGNAGIAFSWVCRKLGYRPVVFMPFCVPEPRRIEVARLADDVHFSHDEAGYLKTCYVKMCRYLQEHRSAVIKGGSDIHIINQSRDARTPEIFGQIVDELVGQNSEIKPDFFVGGIGDGSTILGVGGRAKERYPGLRLVAFEPKEACYYYKQFRQRWGRCAPPLIEDVDLPEGFNVHKITGTGGFGNVEYPFMKAALERKIIDDVWAVPTETVLDFGRFNQGLPEIRRQGNSSVTAGFIANHMANFYEGKVFLSLIYDKADRY